LQRECELAQGFGIDRPMPVRCTSSGKLYLSSLPKESRNCIVGKLPLGKLARNTLTEPESLEIELLKIQANELGTDHRLDIKR
jgi:DNA-binding IclR family transcriptional regulator